MADTLTNPYLQMGIMNMMKPNPYLNPAYQGKPLPMPGYYTGDAGSMGPTDAMGQLIPSFTQANNTAQANYQQQLAAFNAGQPSGGASTAPGTTLNSTPGGQDNGLTALNDMKNNIVAQNLTLQGMPSSLNQGGFGSGNNVLSNFTVTMVYPISFYRAVLDTNAIPLWAAADPNNPGAGYLAVFIDSPANGTVLQ